MFVVLLFATSAMAQQRTITGTVTGKEDGLPLPGVSVKVKGTKAGTMTGSDGKFSISAATGAVIEFSSIGYLGHSRTVGTGSVINVTLESDAKSLGEVIVTANAIKREKRTLGYSAPTIKNDELVQGGSPSVISSLAGKVAGINVTSSSSTPGSSSRVVLRGGSSIAGSNQALIVVDGVPIDNSSVIGGASVLSSVDFGNRGNDLAPDDIASVTVLKGPAAAALYGSRASNGALVITTKTGSKSDKMSVTFTTSNTFSNVLKLPDYQNEYGQGYYDVVAPDGKSATYTQDFRENGSWGAPFTGKVQEWGQMIDGVRQTKPYSAVKNNVKDFFTTGFATDNNLSFSGGGEKTTYFLGLNSLNSNGVFPGNYDQFNKYGVRFNGTTEFNNKFTAGVSFNYTRIDANEVGGGQGAASVYNNVLQTPRDIDLPSLSDLNNKYNGYGFTDAKGIKHPNLYGYYGTYTQNPYWILQNYKNLNDVSRVTGNFNIGYNPYSWLNIKERVGIDTYSDRRRTLSPKYSFIDGDESKDQYPGNNARTNVGNYQIDQFNVTELVHDLMISASHKFNDDFEGSLMIGNNIRQRQTNSLSTATNASGGLVVPGWYNLNNSNGPINVITDQLTKRRLVGLYADLNLSYKNFLFMEATARNDWSSTLPINNNSFFYPSISGSFVFTELMKNSSFTNILSYGKLRSSWAQVGNDTDPYQLLTTYSKATVNGSFGSTVFPFGNVAALTAGTTLGNINLKPERTTAFEIGTELGFLDNRISVDFSYYKSNSKDQILSIPIPNSTGYGFSVVNAGEVQNKGVELSLRGTVIKTSDISWELYGSYTKNNNKVLSLMPGVDQISIGGFSGMTAVAAVGRPYGEFYAVTNMTDNQGRVIVDNTTGMPIPTATAQYVGNYNPKYQASLGTNFRYKHVSLNVLFDTKQGGFFFSRTKDITGFAGVSAETGGNRFGAIFPNSVIKDGNGNYIPNTTVGYVKQDYYTGSRPAGTNIVDGSFVKLRSASLSYTFTKEQLKRTPFGSFAIGLYGNNLFIWTPKSNQWADPEINSAGAGNLQGFDFTAQPSVRNYGINLKVSF